ncbi:MAG TPA: amidohydrolase family protein [Nitrososphaerales archaeon]|nr:amidohydrolase family protein [Nitrososphaerales archaeon]
MSILIFKGRAFDGRNLHRSAVVKIDTDKGVIMEFGERGELEEPRGAKKVELEDATILPGLIDAHVHFYSSRGEGVTSWASVPDTLAVLRGAGDLRRLLSAGFTAVRELGTKGGVHLAQAVAEGSIEGPQVVSCSRALAQSGEDDDPPAFPLEIAQQLASYTYFCDGPWECRKAVRKVARDGGKVVKFYSSGAFSRGGRIKPNFTKEEINAIVEESKRLDLKVAAHAYGEEALGNVVEAGVDSIEHGLGLTSKIATEIAKKGIYYVPTLVTYSNPAYKNRYNEMVKRHLSDDMEIAKEHGVKVVMGSDIVGDAARPHGRNYEEIVAEAKFIGSREALVAATSRAAECLGLGNGGMLKEGFRADAVVVRGNPISDVEALAPEKVLYVVRSGELLSPAH